jgi:hypothetical protein
MNPALGIRRIPRTRQPAAENNDGFMKRLIVGLATTVLVSGGVGLAAGAAQAAPGPAPLHPGPFPADDGDWGPPHTWCPGQSLWITGNHVNNPVVWDNSVCHTYYIVYFGQGNVAQNIWDGPDPPAKPPPPPGLNFCPIPPWCP